MITMLSEFTPKWRSLHDLYIANSIRDGLQRVRYWRGIGCPQTAHIELEQIFANWRYLRDLRRNVKMLRHLEIS